MDAARRGSTEPQQHSAATAQPATCCRRAGFLMTPERPVRQFPGYVSVDNAPSQFHPTVDHTIR